MPKDDLWAVPGAAIEVDDLSFASQDLLTRWSALPAAELEFEPAVATDPPEATPRPDQWRPGMVGAILGAMLLAGLLSHGVYVKFTGSGMTAQPVTEPDLTQKVRSTRWADCPQISQPRTAKPPVKQPAQDCFLVR